MGKKAKEHRKKVAARNASINNDKKKFQKMQHNFLKDLIERERAAGKFDNPVSEDTIVGVEAPTFTEQQGPII